MVNPTHFCCHQHRASLRPLPSRQDAPPTDQVQIGAAGIGDPYFPNLGNGGYDAEHYALKLKVDPKTNQVQASSTMTARAEQGLSSLNLDFHGFDIQKITVNGEKATFEREDGELRIVPGQAIPAGSEFSVQVDYSGVPKRHDSPYAPVPVGWVPLKDGNYVISEPDGAAHWFPCNDHPRDKATYDFEVTVPQGYTAVANGRLEETKTDKGWSTYHWVTRDPMASYLATVNVGKFVEEKIEGPNGLPIHNFYPPLLAKVASYDFGRVPQMIEWFSDRFGPYPFSDYGNLVLNASVGGAALETQTRPVYERGMLTGVRAAEFVYAHELAHQWWGNSVSVQDWKDVWLSEGFATYSHMMWQHEHDGSFAKLDAAMHDLYSDLPTHTAPVAEPGKESLFSENVYHRGAVALHVLRKELGDAKFFEVLKTWGTEFRGKNVTTEDFAQHASKIAGKDLEPFFQAWIRDSELPAWPGAKAA